jgi:WW domain-containing oxidoreductase
VSHLAHYLMVLKLLGGMEPEGRVVMIGSITHYPEKANPLSKLRPGLPEHMEDLVRPKADAKGEEHDRGQQRYGTAKLANVVLMHDLNRRLENVRL